VDGIGAAPWKAGGQIVNQVVSADVRNAWRWGLAHRGGARRCNARAW